MKTILIVDDEPSARYGLRRALEAKYRIAEADSAEAAREALPREQPDLVLLDVVLPGKDGLSFLKWLREQGSEVPVLMVSALDTALHSPARAATSRTTDHPCPAAPHP